MKKTTFILILLCYTMGLIAQNAKLRWIHNIGGMGDEIMASLSADNQGNLYLTGSFSATADFDPSSSSANLISSGGTDIFIAKYDSSGNFLWAKKAGGPSDDWTTAVQISSSGAIYLTGIFKDSADFNPTGTSHILTSAGDIETFIAKFNAQGDFLWAKSIAGLYEERIKDIALGYNDNFVITGSLSFPYNVSNPPPVDFDPGPDTANVNHSWVTSGFLAQYDSSGNHIWAKTLGSYITTGNSVAISGINDIYVTGSKTNTSSYNTSIYLAKYSYSGNNIWDHFLPAMGSYFGGTGSRIIVDGTTLYLAGIFQGTYSFGSSNLTSNGGQDIFLARFSTNGANLSWAYNIGGKGDDAVHDLARGPHGIYIAGSFEDTIDLDPSTQPVPFSSNGSKDAFVAIYSGGSAGGGFRWGQSLGGIEDDESTSSFIDGKGNIFLSGTFANAVNFNPDSLSNVTAAGGADIFLGKYFPCILDVKINTTDIIQCSGPCSGYAIVQPWQTTGSSLSYQWSPKVANQNANFADSLCADSYSVEVSDAEGCKVQKKFTIDAVSSFDPQVSLTNIAAVDQGSVSPAFDNYYSYNLPDEITPNPSNPRNFVDPGEKVRFKVEAQNQKSNGQSVVSGVCKIRSNSPYITIMDSTSALNNIGWNQYAWSFDEFEIDIAPNTPPGNIYIDYVVQENGVDYATRCIPIPIHPLVYSTYNSGTVDDDTNPDSDGNNNNIAEPGETIEFYPWLNNVSDLDAQYVRGRLENLNNYSFVEIWDSIQGVNSTVFDATWWNYGFGQPQSIASGDSNMTPEYDFVFRYDSTSTVNNFELQLVMAGGFELFSGNALSLVQWSLPFDFSSVPGSNTSGLDNLIAEQIQVYPNPSEGNIIITLDAQLSRKEEIQIVVRNVLGQSVFTTTTTDDQMELDLTAYASGVYFLEINTKDRQVVKKVLME